MIQTPTYSTARLASIRQEAIDLLKPQQQIEYDFLDSKDFLIGLDWGIPRFGHPEGKILYHIQEVLENVHAIPDLDENARLKLRIITFVHDTFKYKEDKARPRNWLKHHAIHARNFLAQYIEDQALLDLVELHDEAYYIWRTIHLQHQKEIGALRKQRLLERIGDNLQLYYLFFKCDTLTGDKIPTPLQWFEKNMKGIEVVRL
ncbi:MAG: hypothetical protein AAF847_00710 [Bacteroidota bacterium]